MTTVTVVTITDRITIMPRWFSATLSVIIYLEMLIGSCFLKMPEPKQPDIWKPMEPLPYQPGPYDNDWDGCWTDERTGIRICLEEQI